MRNILAAAFVYAAFQLCGNNALAHPVVDAALRENPLVRWIEDSAIYADFTCVGKSSYAILGVTSPSPVELDGRVITEANNSVVVAIFNNGLNSPPRLLEYSSFSIDSVTIIIEPLDTTPQEYIRIIGSVPEGVAYSKSCKGISLSDGERETVHIYWNKKRKKFSEWVL